MEPVSVSPIAMTMAFDLNVVNPNALAPGARRPSPAGISRVLQWPEWMKNRRKQTVAPGDEPGTRDLGGAAIGLAMPVATFGGAFLRTVFFEMATAYLFHPVFLATS